MSLGDDEKLRAWTEYRTEVMVARLTLDEALEGDEILQSAILARCRPGDGVTRPVLDGFWFWVRTFGVHTEARNVLGRRADAQALVPFFHQERLVSFIWSLFEQHAESGNPQTGLVIKSRDLGATWIVLHFIVWAFLFLRGVQILVGSQKEDKVDKAPGTGNLSALFGRIEFIMQRLPVWMVPWLNLRDTRAQRQMLLFMNPENGAFVAGESSNPSFGRQNRYWLIFCDEFDLMDHAAEILGSIRDSSAVQLLVTTPNRDLGEQSTAKRMKAEGRHDGLFEVNWWEHPTKTRKWYAQEGKVRFEEDLGSELDLSWEGSDRDLVYPIWKRVPAKELEFDARWGSPWVGIDYGRSDGTGIVYGQQSFLTSEVRFLAAYYNQGQKIDYYLPFLGGEIASGTYSYSDEELEFAEYVRPICKGAKFYGDPSGEQHHQSADRSVAEDLRRHRIYVISNPAMIRHAERQSRLKEVLQNAEVSTEHCRLLDASFRNYRKQRWKPGMVVPTRRPLHDWSSHLVTACEFFAVNRQAHHARKDEEPRQAVEREVAAWERIGQEEAIV